MPMYINIIPISIKQISIKFIVDDDIKTRKKILIKTNEINKNTFTINDLI